MKIIYIMGAGHIGSTVFDVALGNHPHIESLGEISKFHRFGWRNDSNRKCACGDSVFNCNFWSQVRQEWSMTVGGENFERYIELENRIEKSRLGWIRLLFNRIMPSSQFEEYTHMTTALYKAVQKISGNRLLVDSSLTPRRAYALTMNPHVDFYLIHFIRDGRGVIWSLKKPGKKILTKVYVPKPAWRTAKYWISANLQSTLAFSRLSTEKRIRIRYEDYTSNPEFILKKIGSWIQEDMSGIIVDSNKIISNKIRHTVGGNRVRMLKDITIKPDIAWMDNLSERDRKLFWFMAGWLAKKYGYIQHPV
jgi:hypothetical protein